MFAGKDWVWKPLQQKAIEFNKDGYLFPKPNPVSSTAPETPTATRHSSAGVVVNTQGKMEEHSAKEHVEARYQKIKSWWDSKRKGGPEDP